MTRVAVWYTKNRTKVFPPSWSSFGPLRRAMFFPVELKPVPVQYLCETAGGGLNLCEPFPYQGFNSTLTEPVHALGRRGAQIREMELKLHPDVKEPLRKLSNDPKTTIVVLSGSNRNVLDNHVFVYFTERTPRSHFKLRETSLVWNYKYADVEFGRIQSRDLLQHLCTGPISNASVDVVQGGRCVEVPAVGVTKGAAIDHILGEIIHNKGMKAPIDYVLSVGHVLAKDEDVYTFFGPELPSESPSTVANLVRTSTPKFSSLCRSEPKASRLKKQRSMSTLEKKENNHESGIPWHPTSRDRMSLHEGSSVLDLKGDNYFSCAVRQKLSSARYLLGTLDDVVNLLNKLAEHSSSSS